MMPSFLEKRKQKAILVEHIVNDTKTTIIMKATELIKRIQDEVAANGDKDVVIAANKHSYADVKVVTRESNIVLALFDKIAD